METLERKFTERDIHGYLTYLREQERSKATIEKYRHDIYQLLNEMAGCGVNKDKMVGWKEHLVQNYAASSVNGMLAALNGFMDYLGWPDLKLKPLKIQRDSFLKPEKELNRVEYERLVMAANRNGNERLSLILQTVCATGIRVSELSFITVEAVSKGRAEAACKGKRRAVFLPGRLCALLKRYIRKHRKKTGAVFTTRSGRPMDRSNIWREMKLLCGAARVDKEKVFPHNLRHLFARTYYTMEKDISRLADILGHSNVVTTRIYTMESGSVHARQLERLDLIIT